MRIALLAHIRHPIAQPFMGGMEAHSWMLADALQARGHDVTLFASGDSDPRFAISPIVGEHYDRTFPWHDFHGTDALNDHLDTAFAATCDRLARSDIDVVHNNSLHRFPVQLARTSGIAMVTTLHVPPFIGLARAVRETPAPSSRFTVPSTSQLEAWWPGGAPDEAAVVPNGIDIGQWRYSPDHDGSALWFGRITPNKGTHLAAAAAAIVGVPLTIYGAIEHRDYFETEVRPRLTAQIQYGGHLDGPDLAEHVRRAAALLFTPLWDEPFGLAAVEAMACGVPVASLDRGAAREVIGDAGCYAETSDAEGLAAALRRAMAVPRPIPRARIERLFTLDRMVDRYEQLYEEVRQSRTPRSTSIITGSKRKQADMDAYDATLALLATRASDATICPSEVARSLGAATCSEATGSNWRSMMPIVHAAIDRLVTDGKVRLSWKGQMLTSRRGPYRIGVTSAGGGEKQCCFAGNGGRRTWRNLDLET